MCHKRSSCHIVYGATSTCKSRGSMDPVHGGGPLTRGPCFVLSPCGTTHWERGQFIEFTYYVRSEMM